MRTICTLSLALGLVALSSSALGASIVEQDRRVLAASTLIPAGFDDATQLEQSDETQEPGIFERSYDASVAANFNSVRSEATQLSDVDPAARTVLASGSAISGLYVQGLGISNATSVVEVVFDVGPGGVIALEYAITVDDAIDGDFSFDRPADATVLVQVSDDETGAVVFEASLALDDQGTLQELETDAGPVEVALAPGRYQLGVAAIASDSVNGGEVVGSLAAATYDLQATISDSPCPGDATGDGTTDLADLNLVLANWQTSVPVGTGGDVDFDGDVDLGDLNVVLANWQQSCT